MIGRFIEYIGLHGVLVSLTNRTILNKNGKFGEAERRVFVELSVKKCCFLVGPL